MSSRNTPGSSPRNGPGKKPSKSQIQKQQAAKRAMAAASGAKAARNKRLVQVIAPILTVVVVVGILIGVKVATGNDHKANTASMASQAVTNAVTHVADSVFDKVGKQNVSGPSQQLTGAALTANGKPELLYIGADWCPYCAAERWALAAALSRFGTLTDLGQTASSPDDTDPNTATLSFHGSKYSSDYISASTKDIQDGDRKPLDKLTGAEEKLWLKLTGNQGSFPFIDIGGKYQFGVQYDPAVLKGLSHAQIADQMSDPSTTAGQAIIGAANVLTAAICDVTDGQPASVCTSKAVTAAKPLLGSGSDLTKDQSNAGS